MRPGRDRGGHALRGSCGPVLTGRNDDEDDHVVFDVMNGPEVSLALLRRLAAKTKIARAHTAALEAERNAMIAALVADHSTREIAKAASLTQARVVQINNRAREHAEQVLDEPRLG